MEATIRNGRRWSTANAYLRPALKRRNVTLIRGEVRKINFYVEQKNLKTVTLNEAKFLERRNQLNSEKENEKAIEKQVLPSREIDRNYYLDEVLRITSDYVELLGKKI